MKKLRSLLIVLLGVLFVVALAACGGGDDDDGKFTVTFETYGGTQIEPYRLAEGETIQKPEDPTKDLFTFDGWFADADFTAAYTFGQKMPAHDVTVYARWTSRQSSRILFDAMGGSWGNDENGEPIVLQDIVGTVGSRLKLPADPVYDGYRFVGWYMQSTYEDLFGSSVFPASSITLYARWQSDPNYAYVDFYGNGERIARVPVLKGQKIVDPELFGEEYVSLGWFKNEALTEPYEFGVASSNLSLYTSYYTKGLTIVSGTVTGYTGEYANVVIPSSYEGRSVTMIGENAFAENTNIHTVDLPASVADIEQRAFYRCSYLTDIDISKNVSRLGAYAFFECSRLVSYGDITGVTAIPDGVFLGCKKLPAVTLSENATSIGAQAFADCAALREIVIPARVTALNDGLFDGCTSLTKVALPAALTTFGSRVFVDCGKLSELTLDASNTQFKVLDGNLYRGNGTELLFYACGTKGEKQFRLLEQTQRIAAGAFDANETLESITVGSASVTIACGAFGNMKALTSLTVPALGGTTGYLAYYFGASEAEEDVRNSGFIPETLHSVTLTGAPTMIGDFAFCGAVGLEEVSGLDQVSAIGESAFAYTGLKQFKVPAGLTSLNTSAFQGCSHLEQFTMEGTGTFSVYDGCLYGGTQLRCVPALKTSIEFKEGTTEIANSAFSESHVEEVVIPESVTFIDYAAFRICNYLKSLTVPFIGSRPNQLNYMGYIFGSTVTLVDQTDSDGNEYRGMEIANGSMIPTSLQTIKITSKQTSVPDAAFAYFRGLENVVFADGSAIASIGAYAFYSTAIRTWDFTGITSIFEGAFREGSLKEVSLPATLQSFGYAAFRGIEPLEKITLAEGITEIGIQAFYASGETNSSSSHGIALHSNYSGELVIPSTVTEIGSDAFFGIGMLFDGSNRNAPNEKFSVRFARNAEGNTALRVIGDGAFAYSALRTVEIPESVEEVGVQAFLYNDSLKTVTFGSAEKTSKLNKIGGLGFAGCVALTDFTMYVPGLVTMELYENKLSQTNSEYWDIFREASKTFTIRVPQAQVDTYKAADNWKTYANRIVAIGAAEGGGN